MNIEEAIQRMIDCEDYEVVWVGEAFWWHKDSYLVGIERLGFNHEEATKGFVTFCNDVVDRVEKGRRVRFPDYKEDLVALIARHCRVGERKAA